MRATRRELAGYIAADADDVVLVENASGGVNAVLRSLKLERGQTCVSRLVAGGGVSVKEGGHLNAVLEKNASGGVNAVLRSPKYELGPMCVSRLGASRRAMALCLCVGVGVLCEHTHLQHCPG